jgi:RHS repeat-associated protein
MHLTLYGALGEKLAVYQKRVGSAPTAEQVNVWFAGQMVSGQYDRLGSVVNRFYPYGEAIGPNGAPSTAGNDQIQFATYTRDSFTGMDYADQRLYASTYGRFNTADPYSASGGPNDPGSWNRYSYTRGDPINSHDPHGLQDCNPAINPEDCCLPSVNFSLGATPLDDPGCMDPGPGGGGPQPPAPPAPPGPDMHQLCENNEIGYLTSYLTSYGSPLASSAAQIVYDADAAGLDDRFIVALAGAETTYGKIKHPRTWGTYNVFDNALHCDSLSNPMCVVVDPYTSYAQAISGVLAVLTGPLYTGLNTTDTIFPKYSNGGSPGTLDTIYQQLGGTNTTNVRTARCPD